MNKRTDASMNTIDSRQVINTKKDKKQNLINKNKDLNKFKFKLT